MADKPLIIEPGTARAAWLAAQRLDAEAPFGDGPRATALAVAHLGYVQIDTISVVERSHHHILFTRIPGYRRADLEHAQSRDRLVFEYWTHALAYVPTADYRFFVGAMEGYRAAPERAFAAKTDPRAYAALLRRIRRDGELSIRDIDDDVLVEKTHPWGSRKPSKAALRFGFFAGDLTVSRRTGMVKSYELAGRHFGWSRRPRPSSAAQYADYLLGRAVRAQGVVSLDSICYGDLTWKTAVAARIATEIRRKRLKPVRLAGHETVEMWAPPHDLDAAASALPTGRVHILSPFDPLVIQRKRLKAFFGHEHKFEAYTPPEKRVLGYFALPVLVGDRIVAAIDLKADRKAGRLLIRKWTWFAEEGAETRAAIDGELARFERFQLSRD